MLKQIAAAFALLIVGAAPALAQNADEIARVQNGQPCEGCNLFQADLAYLELPGINVANSRLRQSNLSLVTMDRASLRNANLSVANLFGGRFTGADFSSANLDQAVLVGGYFGGANFEGASLEGANLSGGNFSSARGLTQAQLDAACGDASTRLPAGLHVRSCR